MCTNQNIRIKSLPFLFYICICKNSGSEGCFFVFLGGMEQKIWVDIGESDTEKDRMLMELEKECLEIYRRKVDEAANSKAQLHQSLVSIEAEVASIMAALGVLNIHSPVCPKFMTITIFETKRESFDFLIYFLVCCRSKREVQNH